MPFDDQRYVKDGKRWHVGAVKGRHLTRALFCRAVPAEDLIVKVYNDFGDLEGAGNHQGTE